MAVKAHADPDPKHPGADLTALAIRDAVKTGAGAAFREHLQREAVDLRTLVMTAEQPIDTDQSGHMAASIGVLNPTVATVYWGIGGTRPQPGQRAIAQPGKSLLVLPLHCGDFAVGAAPADLVAGEIVVFVMRFACIQPCSLGAVA